MPSLRIDQQLSDQVYFITFTVHNWYYLFDRHNRFEILEQSFVYCQKQKHLEIFAFVFMLNHLHFIARAPNIIGVIRDLKTFLSKELQKNMIAFEPQVLKIFEKEKGHSIWSDTNYPELIESERFLQQKINYIHQNPVTKQYVAYPEDWIWSSASKVLNKIQITSVG